MICDDLLGIWFYYQLATGGTACAGKDLVEKAEGVVAGYVFVIELKDLKGRDRLGNSPIVCALSSWIILIMVKK